MRAPVDLQLVEPGLRAPLGGLPLLVQRVEEVGRDGAVARDADARGEGGGRHRRLILPMRALAIC